MTQEPVYPPEISSSLADVIKLCLNKDFRARPEISEVLALTYFQKEKKKPTLLSSPLKLSLSLSGGKFKRNASQSQQRVSGNLKPLLPVKGKSVDKRDRDASSELDYNSLLKDLSRISATADEKPRLIRTAGMQPCSYATKNGKISILKDGSVEIDLAAKKKKIVKISPEGGKVDPGITHQISVANLADGLTKLYSHSDLPAKYHSVYKYAYEVINLIKAKIPRVRLENQTGRFFLMMNEPYPNYEAYFSSRLVVKHIVGTDVLKLTTDDGERTVNLNSGDLETLDPETKAQVRTALKYLDFCLKSE